MFKVVFPHLKMPWRFSISGLPQFDAEISAILDDLGKSVYLEDSNILEDYRGPRWGKGSIDCPSSEDWVLIDLATHSIIHRLFLKHLIVPYGEYMVLPIRSSVIAVETFKTNTLAKEALKALDNTRAEGTERNTYMGTDTIKLKFPTHDMPFIVPVVLARDQYATKESALKDSPETLQTTQKYLARSSSRDVVENTTQVRIEEPTKIEPIITKIIADINEYRHAPEIPPEPSNNQLPSDEVICTEPQLAAGCPTVLSWIVVNDTRTEVISRSSLQEYIVAGGEYTVLPMSASAFLGEDLDGEIEDAKTNYRARRRRIYKSTNTYF